MSHECFSAGRSDARDVVKAALYLAFAVKASVVFDGKAVCFVLNACNQFETFGMGIDWEFFIIKVKSSGAMIVILDHTANGNGDLKFL